MDELELIRGLCAGLATNTGTVVGAGDDCAVLDLGVPNRWVLLKTDAVVEGVHFLPDDDPVRIGHKALARCLSDVAAMGGTPTHALITLALPDGFGVARVRRIYEGINALATQLEVGIVGGETTRHSGTLLISVSLVGWVDRQRVVLRSGARAGDALFVSGELGGSLASGRHLDFEARLAEGRWLAEQGSVRAMMDLSDGLATDLPRLMAASGVGAELMAEAIPIARSASSAYRVSPQRAKPPLLAALTDGEDFELLFAVAAQDAVSVLDGWKRQFPDVRLSCIGKMTPESGVRIRDAQGIRELTARGYVHFSGS